MRHCVSGTSTSPSTLSKAVLETSPTASSPSRNRQLTHTPVSRRVAAPHFSHFTGFSFVLGNESETSSEFLIRVTPLRRREPHTDAGSRLPPRPGQRPYVRLHHAAASGSAVAGCAAAFSPQSQSLPMWPRDWCMKLHRVPL